MDQVWQFIAGRKQRSKNFDQKNKINKSLTWVMMTQLKWQLLNVFYREMANLAVLCNRTVTLYLQQLLKFPFCEAFLTLNLCFPPFLVSFPIKPVFVHLLKIKAWLMARRSFQSSRVETQPLPISKSGHVCSGLCLVFSHRLLFTFSFRLSSL